MKFRSALPRLSVLFTMAPNRRQNLPHGSAASFAEQRLESRSVPPGSPPPGPGTDPAPAPAPGPALAPVPPPTNVLLRQLIETCIDNA